MGGNHKNNKAMFELIVSLKEEIILLKKQGNKGFTQKKIFYNYAEVAELLCISVEGVRTKVKRGTLERICSDNTPLITRESLNNYLRSQNPNFKGL